MREIGDLGIDIVWYFEGEFVAEQRLNRGLGGCDVLKAEQGLLRSRILIGKALLRPRDRGLGKF